MVERVERDRANETQAAGAHPVSPYDAIARLYDAWSRSVTEDVEFYVEEARRSGGTVVELAVGTGRIAIPVAQDGSKVIGIDTSAEMLGLCRQAAESAGVAQLVDLRLGDLRDPPVSERVELVICPFRSYLHLRTETDRLAALNAARKLLQPNGRLVFDVFAPGQDDIDETDGRWIEREPGIWERADWDSANRTLDLSVRDETHHSTMSLAWLSPLEWAGLIERAGLTVQACYGWFDRRPYTDGEDTIWVARR